MAYSPNDLCFQNKTRMVHLATLVKNISGTSGNKTVSQLTTLVNSFPTKDLSNTSWRTVSESASEISACNLELKSQMESLATAIRNKTGIANTSANKLTREQMIYLLEQWGDEDSVTYRVTVDVSAYFYELFNQPINIGFNIADSLEGPYSASTNFTFDPTDMTSPADQEIMLNDHKFKITDIDYWTNDWNDLYSDYGPKQCEYVSFDLSIPTDYSGYFIIGTGRGPSGYVTSAEVYCSDGYCEVLNQSSGDWGGCTQMYSDEYFSGDEIADYTGMGTYTGYEGYVQKVDLYVYDKSTGEQLSDSPVTIEYNNVGKQVAGEHFPYESFGDLTQSQEDYSASITNLAFPFSYWGVVQLLVLPSVSLSLSRTNLHTDGITYAAFGMSTEGYNYWYDEYSCGTLEIRADFYIDNNNGELRQWGAPKTPVLDLSWW